MKYSEEFCKRFWERVKKTRKCWIWQGYCAKAGYGMLSARKISQQPMLTHRVAWEIANGPIPAGLHVLHSCDNPPCVNPKHLWLGTAHDNSLDRDHKGRVASGDRNGARTQPDKNPFIRNHGSGMFGEGHPQAKLTDKEVARLRKDYANGVNRHQLAKKYGISDVHANRLVKRLSRRK